MRSSLSDLHDALASILEPSQLLSDEHSKQLYAQDIFTRELPAGIVVQPASSKQLAQLVPLCAGKGYAVIARGGGMSYTRAYVPEEENSVLIDTSALNDIIEVNTEDMFVRVGAGCSWKQLHEHLRPLGLRTPFWGPLSGIHATVAGSVSQSSVYWGAGAYGASADSVISLEIVLADGSVLNTGSAAQENATPFFRHFGPDLTGLFCGDCGALGIKASVTLRLMPELRNFAHISYDFDSYRAQISAMSHIAREHLATQMFGTDPTLNRARAQRDSLLNDVKAFGKVLQQADSVSDAIGKGSRMAISGRTAVLESHYPIHATVEQVCQSAATEIAQRIEKICQQHGGVKIDNSVPTLLRASPFNPLNNIVGPNGERWVPIHALLPHSKVLPTMEKIEALYLQHAAEIERFNIQCGFLFTTVSSNCFFLEPLFLWPDELNELHKTTVESNVQRKQNGFVANPLARQCVTQLREELTGLFTQMGASHLQIGKEYHYREALHDPAKKLIEQLKKTLDPQRRINPGALGL